MTEDELRRSLRFANRLLFDVMLGDINRSSIMAFLEEQMKRAAPLPTGSAPPAPEATR